MNRTVKILLTLSFFLVSHEIGLTATNSLQTDLFTKTLKTMIFEQLVKHNKDAFIEKVNLISVDLGIKPEYLMFVMYIETIGTFKPEITNPIGATGLIQFLPSTAKGLGTSTDELRNMTNIDQLDYVHKYLLRFKGRLKDYLDLYLAVFYPAAIGKPDTYTIPSENAARQNPAFDIDKNGFITKAEIRQKLYNKIPDQYKHLFQ